MVLRPAAAVVVVGHCVRSVVLRPAAFVLPCRHVNWVIWPHRVAWPLCRFWAWRVHAWVLVMLDELHRKCDDGVHSALSQELTRTAQRVAWALSRFAWCRGCVCRARFRVFLSCKWHSVYVCVVRWTILLALWAYKTTFCTGLRSTRMSWKVL